MKQQYSWGTIGPIVSGLRFFYENTLKKNLRKFIIPIPKRPKELPEILSREEVTLLLDAIDSARKAAFFQLLYGAGLRGQEGLFS